MERRKIISTKLMKFDIRTLQTEVVLTVHVLILRINGGSNHRGQ